MAFRPHGPGAGAAGGAGVALATLLLLFGFAGHPLGADGGARGDDPAELGRLAFRVFTDRDGLPQNTVYEIARDGKGYLWIGTPDGAAYYDGRTWTTVALPPELGTSYVTTLLPASDGGIWFGTLGGVAHLKDGVFQAHTEKSGLPDKMVRCLLETVENGKTVLWVGTYEGGLARLQGGRFTVFDRRSGLPDDSASALLETTGEGGKRTLWIGTYRGGLATLVDGRITVREDAGPYLSGHGVRVLRETVAPGGMRTLWVGTFGGGLLSLTDGRWTRVDSRSGLPNDLVVDLQEITLADGSQEIWVGTHGGLAVQRDGRWRTYGVRSGLPGLHVESLFVERDAGGPYTLWVGTGSGLARLREGSWITLDTRSGLPDDHVYAIAETRAAGQRTYWLGSFGGGLTRIEPGGRITTYGPRDGLPNDRVGRIVETKAAGVGGPALWIGTHLVNDGGLLRFEGGRFTKVEGLPDPRVTGVLETAAPGGSRTLWVGTWGGGLTRFEGGRVTVYDVSQGLPDNRVGELVTTVTGGRETLWITSFKGLVRREGERFTTLDTRHGLPREWVLCLLPSRGESGERILWVGTSGGGIVWLDLDEPAGRSPRFHALPEEVARAIPGKVVYQIREDRQGRLYLFTSRGVTRLSRRRPTRDARDTSGSWEVRTFTTEDGLPSMECSFAASLVDSQGRLWAGTSAGAAVFDPARDLPDVTRKPLHLQRADASGGSLPVPLRAGGTLPHDRSHLVFEYALLSYVHEGETRYRTRLVGLDREPSPWSAEAKKEYPTLPSGRYVFQVWGRDFAGNVSGPVELAFRIRPAPWLSLWAWLAYAGLAGLLVATGVRTRLRVLEARAAELARLVDERTLALVESNRKLTETQERLDRLMRSSTGAVGDVPAWCRSMASEISSTFQVPALDVFRLDENVLRPLSTSRDLRKAVLPESLRNLDPGRKLTVVDGDVVIPVTGMTGGLLGAIRLPGTAALDDEPLQRLLLGFAHQLGSALELERTRKELASALVRKAESRREMQEKGIATLQICPACGRCYDHTAPACEGDGSPLDASRLLPFRLLDRYRFVRRLGEGGMGIVLAAHDERLSRDVAIKLIRSEHFGGSEMRLRFEREARTIARIQHPGVIELFDSGELPDGSAYLVMEMLSGASVADLLRRHGPGRPRQVGSLLRQGAAALGAAHRASVIHRDVKPENLFLLPRPGGFQLKVLDFGLAKSLTAVEAGLTQTGFMVGTPGYMAPEQALGELVDGRSDLYSFASVAYEALTGEPVVGHDDARPLFVRIVEGVPPPVSAHVPGAPVAVDEAFASALAKDPNARPADVESWAAGLAPLLDRMISPATGWPEAEAVRP